MFSEWSHPPVQEYPVNEIMSLIGLNKPTQKMTIVFAHDRRQKESRVEQHKNVRITPP
jgi:hypothetical protein